MTKSSPEFYDPVLKHEKVRGLALEDLWLLDDSPVNLEASRVGTGTTNPLLWYRLLTIPPSPSPQKKRKKKRTKNLSFLPTAPFSQGYAKC